MKDRIIYQLFLRPFTPEGTLASAEKKLPHIKSLGINTVYLTSCCTADGDSNEEHFSPRQKASKTGNPKNPYRISDYYTIDKEYGSDADLKSFVNTAHNLGLDVLFDVVFLHCGPNPIFLEEHPDFVKRDEDGNIICNAWCFPEINFESASLRRYLIDNMLMWVGEFGFDGFRCDVGDQIPLDFWREAIAELKSVKPSIYMLNEGIIPQFTSVFDSNYNFKWTQAIQTVIRRQNPADFLQKTDEECRKEYGDEAYVCLRALENHDYANDHYENRPDKNLPRKAVDTAHVIDLMMDGIPFIYNGNEIADGNRHSIWGNRDFGKFCIDWNKASTEDGSSRLDLMRQAITLRENNPWLFDAETIWLENTKKKETVSFLRNGSDKKLLVLANVSDESIETEITIPFNSAKAEELWSREAAYSLDGDKLNANIAPYGFAIISLK